MNQRRVQVHLAYPDKPVSAKEALAQQAAESKARSTQNEKAAKRPKAKP